MNRDDRLRLFLGLRLPQDVGAAVARWAERELRGAGRVVPAAHLHVTLAFLGSRPAGELPAVVAALGAAAGEAAPIRLQPSRWRETRGVGMLVLTDEDGAAGHLAGDVQGRLESLGVYARERRTWLPHLTVLRFRERPRLRPALPEIAAFAPSDAAAFLSRLHPSGARYSRGVQYVVLESFVLGGVRG